MLPQFTQNSDGHLSKQFTCPHLAVHIYLAWPGPEPPGRTPGPEPQAPVRPGRLEAGPGYRRLAAAWYFTYILYMRTWRPTS